MHQSVLAIKLKHHLEGFWMAVFGMFLISTVTWFIVFSMNYLFQKFSPYSWYFEYTSIEPVEETFRVGRYPGFRSFSVYKQDVDMVWMDTLICKASDGDVIKYPTQVWPERVFEGTSDKDKIWFYKEHRLSENDSECKLRTSVTAITEMGFRKTWRHETDWIKVKSRR